MEFFLKRKSVFFNFKSINDSYGHAYGDEVLRKISKRIESTFGKNCVVARFSGSEFVVLIDGKENSQMNADKLLEAIREKSTIVIDDNKVECYIDGFAGVSNFPQDSKDYESLIKYADIAMTGNLVFRLQLMILELAILL